MRDQATVVSVEFDHVGHGAQCDQRQQRIQLGLLFWREDPARSQFCPQCQQHVEHHPNACDAFALEAAPRLVRVDDDVRVGQKDHAVFKTWQVVVGHQHLQAQGFRGGNTFHAGDAVVHGDQQVGTAGLDALGNGGRQTVAIYHAVWHQVADMLGAQQPQATQGDSTGGGAVAVVIGHDAEFFVPGNGVCQQAGGIGGTQQATRGQQPGQAFVQIVFVGNATGSKQACQQWMYASLFQRPGGPRRYVAYFNFHS